MCHYTSSNQTQTSQSAITNGPVPKSQTLFVVNIFIFCTKSCWQLTQKFGHEVTACKALDKTCHNNLSDTISSTISWYCRAWFILPIRTDIPTSYLYGMYQAIPSILIHGTWGHINIPLVLVPCQIGTYRSYRAIHCGTTNLVIEYGQCIYWARCYSNCLLKN